MKSHSSASRSGTLDSLRGLTLVSMIAYHTCWDLVYLYGFDWGWYRSFQAYVWQQSICCTFILLSGFCWQMGHHPLRRGLMSFLGGAAVSLVTLLVMPEEPVRFGVLTFLGTAALLTVPLRPLLSRIPPRLGLAVSFGLFLVLRDVNDGFLGFAGVPLLSLPQGWYANLLTAWAFPPRALCPRTTSPCCVAAAVLDGLPSLPPAAGNPCPAGHPPAGILCFGAALPADLSPAPAGGLRSAGAAAPWTITQLS